MQYSTSNNLSQPTMEPDSVCGGLTMKETPDSIFSTNNDVVTPRATDILCGRGKSFLAHPGNKKFINILRSNMGRYQAAPKRIDKSLIVTDIVLTVKEQGARFVKLGPDGETYFVLDDGQAREKTGHAIRDLLKPKSPGRVSKKRIRAELKKDSLPGRRRSSCPLPQLTPSTAMEQNNTFQAGAITANEKPNQELFVQPTMVKSSSDITLYSSAPQRKMESDVTKYGRFFDTAMTSSTNTNTATTTANIYEGLHLGLFPDDDVVLDNLLSDTLQDIESSISSSDMRNMMESDILPVEIDDVCGKLGLGLEQDDRLLEDVAGGTTSPLRRLSEELSADLFTTGLGDSLCDATFDF